MQQPLHYTSIPTFHNTYSSNTQDKNKSQGDPVFEIPIFQGLKCKIQTKTQETSEPMIRASVYIILKEYPFCSFLFKASCLLVKIKWTKREFTNDWYVFSAFFFSIPEFDNRVGIAGFEFKVDC